MDRQAFKRWRHVFKLDPDRFINDADLELVCQSGTDAIMVGGSSGVTFDNTIDLLDRIRRYDLPCVLEVSDQEAIVPGFDLYFIPLVLNTSDVQWLIGQQHEVIKQFGSRLPWDDILPEGYIILNPQSTAAKITKARTELDALDVLSYARMADKMFRLPIVYLEYSGTYGDMTIVKQTKQALTEARLFYGGGIDSLEKAVEAAKAADTIIVGNVIYDNLQKALQTVQINEQMC